MAIFRLELLAAAAVLLTVLATRVPAQQSAPAAPVIKTDPERARQQDMAQREWELRNIGRTPEFHSNRKQLELVTAQLEEDFSRILTLHNQIARAISDDKTLDYVFVSDATAEIKKRATRLQTTLRLHKPERYEPIRETREELADTQLKDALNMLCKRIKSFVTNPTIETPGTVNVEELTNARRNLEDVIEVSDSIRKSANRLKKSVQ